jgi:hypothetical protein
VRLGGHASAQPCQRVQPLRRPEEAAAVNMLVVTTRAKRVATFR